MPKTEEEIRQAINDLFVDAATEDEKLVVAETIAYAVNDHVDDLDDDAVSDLGLAIVGN